MSSFLKNVGAVLVFLIVGRLFFNPSTDNLVPRFETGELAGYTLRSTRFWGLSYTEYPATITREGIVYTDASGKSEFVPPWAYEEE